MARKKTDAAVEPMLPGFPAEGTAPGALPAVVRALFLPDLVRQAAQAVSVDRDRRARAHERFKQWAAQLRAGILLRLREVQAQQAFLDLWTSLGYESFDQVEPGAPWSIAHQWHIPGEGPVDAALGSFRPAEGGAAIDGQPLVLVELKADGADLDACGSRSESPVRQLWRYLAASEGSRWGIVTNFAEVRLYARSKSSKHLHRVLLADLDHPDAFADFYAVFSRAGLLGAFGEPEPPAARLLAETELKQDAVSDTLYKAYASRRVDLIRALQARGVADLDRAIAAAQKLLDRVLFVAFAEKRGLIHNRRQLEQTSNTRIPGLSTWGAFRYLFRAIDRGDDLLGIPGYNGSLFKPDPILDDPDLELGDDPWAAVFRYFGSFDYRHEVTVDVLGNLFERSISDLETLRENGLDAHEADLAERRRRADRRRPGQRKLHGVFYTNPQITEYLVAAALDPAWEARQAEAAARHLPVDETEPDAARLAAYARELLAWLDDLALCDPACGSGAFLVAAYDWFEDRRLALLHDLHRAEPDANECAGSADDWKARSAPIILRNNLHGVDLSAESVEIAHLSLWIRTARPGQPLTTLDANILAGNSVVSDPTVHPAAFDWATAFPRVAARGGFDAIVGNPPYVRHHYIIDCKEHLRSRFKSYDGLADLSVYFIEVAMSELLKIGGTLSYVVTNKWMKSNYGKNIRDYLVSDARILRVVDFGHAKDLFDGVDAFPCFLIAQRTGTASSTEQIAVTILEGIKSDLKNLKEQIDKRTLHIDQARLGAESWSLEAGLSSDLLEKIRRMGVSLKDMLGVAPLIGIMPGRSKAYLISNEDRDHLIEADPGCTSLIKPYLRGQDLRKWTTCWNETWMISMSSSSDTNWPWAGAATTEEAEMMLTAKYPSLYAHFKKHEEKLRSRYPQNIGRFWWELRPCNYMDAFERPKIVYKDEWH
jgi:hypothetical protein